MRAGRLAPGASQLWLTEYGYETNPPDPQAPFSPAQQAGLLARAERLGTADPAVRSWPQFLLRDRPNGVAGPRMRIGGDWQTGLEQFGGNPKPAYAAFRTPVVALCAGGRALVWGRWRGVAGAVAQIERQTPTGWIAAGRPLRVAAPSAAFQETVAWQDGAPARVHWTAPDGHSADSPAVAPQPCPQNRGSQLRKMRSKRH